MAQDVSEDVCDSWEDMIENGILEKKLEELQMKTPKINSSEDDGSDTLYPQMHLEDNSRTPYIPQVKILKRPNDAKSVGTVCDRSPSRQPVKTLMQRKAEYAEARLRILGSAHSEEDDQTSSNASPISVTSLEKKNEAEVVVLRLPRGPDGTNGFLQPRQFFPPWKKLANPAVKLLETVSEHFFRNHSKVVMSHIVGCLLRLPFRT